MNAARIDKSDRLRRVLAALKKAKKPLTTRDIQERAKVCAVNSCIAELRANRYHIKCWQRMTLADGQRKRIWYYSLKGGAA